MTTKNSALQELLEELQPIDDGYEELRPRQVMLWKQRKVDSTSRKTIPDTEVYWAAITDPDGERYRGCSDKSWDEAVANARETLRKRDPERPTTRGA